MIQRAYKFRLYPNIEQKILIAKTLGSCRFIYNLFLSKWNSSYKETGKGLSYTKCSKELPILKISHPWLKEIDSTSLQSS